MKSILTIFLFLSVFNIACAQIISTEKIKAVPQKKFYNTTDSTLVFPVFKMKNKTVENKINQKIINDFKKDREIEKKVTNIKSMLKTASEDGLTDLDFEVTYQTQKLISFNFLWGGMGAYPTTWRTYYSFNLETGKLLTLDSLISKYYKSIFLAIVKNKQATNISLYKKELLSQLRKNEVDKETYEWSLNQINNNCWGYYNPRNFIITKDKLTIIIDCEFPHAIQALSPDSEIKIPLSNIERYLNKKYKSLIR